MRSFVMISLTPALALACALHCGLAAQTLEGRVLDGGSRQPLPDAHITLLHPDGRALGEPVTTGDDGAFRLSLPGVGEYYIRIERTSYTPIVDGIFEFTETDGRMEVEAFLLPRPIELEGIEARVDRPEVRRSLREAGFYERAAQGFGDFISPEEIEKRGVVGDVSDYLRSVPGVHIYSSLVLFRHQSPRAGLTRFYDGGRPPEPLYMCEPNVWIDGSQMTKATYDGTIRDRDLEQGLDSFLNPDDIVAIEVYRHASSTPLQWGGLNGSCGTVLIWTNQGR